MSAVLSKNSSCVNFVRGRHPKTFKKTSQSATNPPEAKSRFYCRLGDKSHLAPDCRHRSSKCDACEETGHLSNVCRCSRRHNYNASVPPEVPFYFVAKNGPVRICVRVGGKPILMEDDSSSAVSTMPFSDFESICPKRLLHKTDLAPRTATGQSFRPQSRAL